jgi:predicted enzyme related to lactoylglutathione lyase
MNSPVTWFEITAPDSDGLRRFYGELFGWTAEPVGGDMDYGTIEPGEGGIAGGIGGGEGPAQAIFYVQVADVQATLDRIEAAGGKTVVPETVIPDMVTFGQFADPSGNVVGLVKG